MVLKDCSQNLNEPLLITAHHLLFLLLLFYFSWPSILYGQSKDSNQMQTAFYVSPNGNGKKCTLKVPCSLLMGLTKSQNADRTKTEIPIHLILYGGNYFLKEALTLRPIISGTPEAPFIIQAFGKEKPVLSGGIKITGWELFDRNKNIYRAPIQTNTQFRNLFINGRRAVRARSQSNQLTFTASPDGYIHSYPDLRNWKNPRDLEIVHLFTFKSYRCKVSEIQQTLLKMQEPCWRNSQLTGLRGDATWIENAYELLDEPGEWYADIKAGWVYYKPLQLENIHQVEAIAPQLEVLLKFEGTKEVPVHDIHLEGITISHSNWFLPESEGGASPVQADFFLTGPGQTAKTADYSPEWLPMTAAVQGSIAQQVQIKKCNFEHLGGAGISLDIGSKNNIISESNFSDISGSAIRIGNIHDPNPTDVNLINSDNSIRNNIVKSVATENLGSVGIWVGYTQRTRIESNEISKLPYTGISLGWGWGIPGPTVSAQNSIRKNNIHHVMLQLVDGGGIYTLGDQPSTIIEENFVHDIGQAVPDPNFGLYRGIYLDLGSKEIVVQRNVLKNVISWLSISNAGNLYTQNYHDDENPLEISEIDLEKMGNYLIVNHQWPFAAIDIASKAGKFVNSSK